MSTTTKYPCKEYACRIQGCLVKNDYNQDRCVQYVKALEQCCRQMQQDGVADAQEACGSIWRRWEREAKQAAAAARQSRQPE
ncbi:uncharacterized protein BJ171DRAFT_520512 [Polychytrium aggregatum]|uniref:uncharacterized protein n=1 Tax=Polychytrium aggregatum TaxID=110093 RepID=UPI0022FF32D6|nr:uncharacterized protein BJ171DRAFT_520512 [Polychytrium aggregatum]KAI9197292.1 hypothetical protein BJ171DRAFT_520512 [Polychytrium aggregatum]